MRRKRKPVQADSKTRVSKLHQAHDTPAPDQFQCPRCKLSGNADLFQPGWPERTRELIANTPGLRVVSSDFSDMSYQDARYLYNWLSRHGG